MVLDLLSCCVVNSWVTLGKLLRISAFFPMDKKRIIITPVSAPCRDRLAVTSSLLPSSTEAPFLVPPALSSGLLGWGLLEGRKRSVLFPSVPEAFASGNECPAPSKDGSHDF